MNPQRYNQVLAKVEANPKHWNQRVWHCGSSHCFAGFGELEIHNLPPSTKSGDLPLRSLNADGSFPWRITTFELVQQWLELTDIQASWLFSSSRTLDDFRWVRRMHGRNPD